MLDTASSTLQLLGFRMGGWVRGWLGGRCMHGWAEDGMDRWTDGQMDKQLERWLGRQMDGWLDRQMKGQTDG